MPVDMKKLVTCISHGRPIDNSAGEYRHCTQTAHDYSQIIDTLRKFVQSTMGATANVFSVFSNEIPASRCRRGRNSRGVYCTRPSRSMPGLTGKTLGQVTKFFLPCRPAWKMVSAVTKFGPDLSRLFHALTDPARRAIVSMRHVSVLEEEGRTRTCALLPEALDPMRTWLDGQRAGWMISS
jgi:hypothetical protein